MKKEDDIIRLMKIVGITGTLGAGKGTVVDYLVKNRDFKHFSVRAYLTDLIIKDGDVVNRDSMTLKANNLRSKYGSSYIIDELYKLANMQGKDCVIESIRTPGEIESLKKRGNFYLLAVDADPKIRYERVVNRASETDKISYEEFLSNEKREMVSTDPNKQNLSKCIEMADHIITNNGNLDELYKKVEVIFKK
jgi:dephospho-CoA kinase